MSSPVTGRSGALEAGIGVASACSIRSSTVPRTSPPPNGQRSWCAAHEIMKRLIARSKPAVCSSSESSGSFMYWSGSSAPSSTPARVLPGNRLWIVAPRNVP
jgi:hypothetical protein